MIVLLDEWTICAASSLFWCQIEQENIENVITLVILLSVHFEIHTEYLVSYKISISRHQNLLQLQAHLKKEHTFLFFLFSLLFAAGDLTISASALFNISHNTRTSSYLHVFTSCFNLFRPVFFKPEREPVPIQTLLNGTAILFHGVSIQWKKKKKKMMSGLMSEN